MAFKKPVAKAPVPESPDCLFMDLQLREHKSLLDHQGQVLRSYCSQGLNVEDVALQLPTGSGKTLVGLLIAEWRRRKFQEKVVYLCPTRQLVNQVAEEASFKCGLKVESFTGPKDDYRAQAKAAYNDADRISIITYSSLFNVNPFFSDPDIVILDDAHTSENYIANMWTVKITYQSDQLLFEGIANILKNEIDEIAHDNLIKEPDSSMQWVDKIPTPNFVRISNAIRIFIDENISQSNQRFSWSMIKDNLHACHLYMSSREILIRPLIPPTWTHEPFATANQRIFISATLGLGGDLERLTGRKNILRLPIPKGWDQQGVGRRFFIFPEKSLEKNEIEELRSELIRKAGRCLILAPNNSVVRDMKCKIENNLKCQVFSGEDLENHKDKFVNTESAVAVVANRYDGIDFPDDDCRLLFIDNLQRAINLQELFLMSRMAAKLLFSERIQTRVLQAIGRCSRGLNDYSAIVITGHLDYLSDQKNYKYFHPELQAELIFGINQSKNVQVADLLDNFRIFLEHGDEWEDANDNILQERNGTTQEEFPAINELAKTVRYEIDWQKTIWEKDYKKAFDNAREILGKLNDSGLRGYRVLWYYLAGSAAQQFAVIDNDESWNQKARQQFEKSKEAAPSGISWLSTLANFSNREFNIEEKNQNIISTQIEQLEQYLDRLGTVDNRKFSKREREICEGLKEKAGKEFENAHKLLGQHLGFHVETCKGDAAPDVLWRVNSTVIVFEDNADADKHSPISARKARQAASHSDWVSHNLKIADREKILSVLVTPARKAMEGAIPSLDRVYYWKLEDFLTWSKTAVKTVRELRCKFTEIGSPQWRTEAIEELKNIKADVCELFSYLSQKAASEHLESQ